MHPSSDHLLKLIDVHKQYDSPDQPEPLQVLRGVDLEVDQGDSIAIVGPSGSGKTTLLNIIGGLDRATSGEVRLAGRELGEASESELTRIRREQIGFVFQLHHLLPQCTVLENVLIPTLAMKGREATSQAEARALRLLERVGLAERHQHRPAQLSGGERQRVAVVRALINQPRLLLADEPTGSLDASTAAELTRLLVELNREEELALIVVTHAEAVAQQMGRVYPLVNGRLRG